MKRPEGRRLRNGRASISSQIYLITTVTSKRKPIFLDLYEGRILVQSIYDVSLDAQTLCYVVMPDHFHWLVQLGEGHAISRVVQRVKACSGFNIKQKLSMKEKLWQAGYHDHAIRKDEDIKMVARYVIANPLRAGLVNKIEDYPLWDACWLE